MMQTDQMRKHIPKIALLGLILESNRFARPAYLDDFESPTVKRGKALIDDARSTTPSIIVKSRGHFRAGFAPWFQGSNIYEIDTVGLTSLVLSRWDFKNVPQPSFPFQTKAEWKRCR